MGGLGTASFTGNDNEPSLALVNLTETGRRLLARPGGVGFSATFYLRVGGRLTTRATVTGTLRLGSPAGR